jgi:hypothetical protein
MRPQPFPVVFIKPPIDGIRAFYPMDQGCNAIPSVFFYKLYPFFSALFQVTGLNLPLHLPFP